MLSVLYLRLVTWLSEWGKNAAKQTQLQKVKRLRRIMLCGAPTVEEIRILNPSAASPYFRFFFLPAELEDIIA